MSTVNKRYYWLKLKNDFFNDKRIKRLRKIAGGDTYTIIYLKMLLISLETNGALYYEGVEDNFISELALDIDENDDDVAATVNFLLRQGLLIESTNSDEFLLTEVKDLVASETASARRVRRMRENKMLQCNTDVTESNKMKQNGNGELELELELELDSSCYSDVQQRLKKYNLNPKDSNKVTQVLKNLNKDLTYLDEKIEVVKNRLRNKANKDISKNMGLLILALKEDWKTEVNPNVKGALKNNNKFLNFEQGITSDYSRAELEAIIKNKR